MTRVGAYAIAFAVYCKSIHTGSKQIYLRRLTLRRDRRVEVTFYPSYPEALDTKGDRDSGPERSAANINLVDNSKPGAHANFIKVARRVTEGIW